MKNKILSFLVIGFAVGCASPVISSNNVNSSNSKDKDVIFSVKIDKSIFSSKNREIEARLYDSQELDISAKTNNCSVSYDAVTKKETVNCPPGVIYKPSNPEIFKFNLESINNENITINSKTVKVGENYRLNLSGLSKDECNRASVSIEQKAESENIKLSDLMWSSTEMACLNK